MTKASKYLAGRMCQELGLRYAPEIRFYKDNTLEQYEEQDEQAQRYLQEIEEDKQKGGETLD